MTSELETDILTTIGSEFFKQSIYGIRNTLIHVKCQLCNGNKTVDIVHKGIAFVVKCPQCDGDGILDENSYVKYQTNITYLDITLDSEECRINQLCTNVNLECSDDITLIKDNIKRDLYHMWMRKWYNHIILHIHTKSLKEKCYVCNDMRYIKTKIHEKDFDIPCPECTNKYDTLEFSILSDYLRAVKFTINSDDLIENIRYWTANSGEISPYFTYNDAELAKQRLMAMI